MQGSNASWPVGGATRQSGGNWVGRFEKPEDWVIWASMYSSNLELGQLITVGDSILKWTASGIKFVDAVFATQDDLDSFCSKLGTNIAPGSTATVAGGAKQWNGTGWDAAGGSPADIIVSTPTGAAIKTALDSAYAAGGGIVRLLPITYTLTEPLPIYSGVWLMGEGATINPSTYAISGGTILVGDGTFAAFEYNAFDLGSNLTNAQIKAGLLNNIRIESLGIKNFTFGLHFGGLYNPAFMHSIFRNLVITNCTDWAVYAENFGYSFFENIVSRFCNNGQWYCGSAGANYNFGNSNFRRVFNEMGSGGTPRGIVFCSRGTSSAFNDLIVQDVQSNSNYGSTTQAATMSNGIADITITDGTKFQLGMPVTVSATANGFTQNRIYFVSSVIGNVIQLANTSGYGTAISATGSSAVNIVTYGWPALEIAAFDSSASVQSSSFASIDVEGNSTCRALIQKANVTLDFATIGGVQGSNCAALVCARDGSAAVMRATSPMNFDIDSASASGTQYLGGSVSDDQAVYPFIQFPPSGTWYSRKRSRWTFNIARTLAGEYGSLMSRTMSGQDFIQPAIGLGQRVGYSASTSLSLSGAHVGAIAFTGSSAGTWTLPTISGLPTDSNTQVGCIYEISNSSASTLTVNTGGSQTFSRQAGKTSYSVAAGGSLCIRAQYDGTAWFWQVLANINAT